MSCSNFTKDAVLGVLNSNSGGGLKFGVGGTGFLPPSDLAGGGGGGGTLPPLKSPARFLFDGPPKNSSCNRLIASSGSAQSEMKCKNHIMSQTQSSQSINHPTHLVQLF